MLKGVDSIYERITNYAHIFLLIDVEVVFCGNSELRKAEVVVNVVGPPRPHLLRDGDVGHAAHVQLHVQDGVSGCKMFSIQSSLVLAGYNHDPTNAI